MKFQKRTTKDGKTRYYVRVHIGNGVYEGVGTYTTKREAEVAYDEAKARLRGGQAVALKQADFTTFTDSWLASLTVRSSTKADYENTARHLKAYFGHRQLQSIKPEHVRQFVKEYSENHSPYTVRKAIARLRQILNLAVADGYIARSPAAGRIPNAPRITSTREITLLEPEEVLRLLDSAPDYWKPLVVVAAHTGLRRGELFGLTWDDVNLSQNKLRVRYQLSDRGERTELKTEAAKRTIDLSASATEALAVQKRQCPDNELDLVFPTPSGKPVHTSNFNRGVWVKTRDRAGLPGVGLHDLRHTFASLLIQNGESVKYVQTVMGHADAQTTLNVYGHLFQQTGSQAAERLDNSLSLGLSDAP